MVQVVVEVQVQLVQMLVTTSGTNGGDGTASSITGSSVTYAGGGGGGLMVIQHQRYNWRSGGGGGMVVATCFKWYCWNSKYWWRWRWRTNSTNLIQMVRCWRKRSCYIKYATCSYSYNNRFSNC
jgi:hypothetical protein